MCGVEVEHRPLAPRMSSSGLTSEAQLRYMLQWFGEFSELQREDFLSILAAARGDNPDQLAATLANLSCQDKPMSLFQCRIKLFNEWYPTWVEEDQDRFVKAVSEADPEFGTKLQDIITNGPQVNGDVFEIVEIVPNVNEHSDENHDSVEENEGQNVPQDNIPVEIAAAS
ncbi:hypothetical protein K1T71_010811 [Dendrolimus kikuchii]|uniref:Uncharacterized protein n=1 Tax=Dendrolimus kikuchii TaxID=765133 RepID=A0ACC1CQ90_9NEOP|nr:hypothetical protein K1T71_010811 [Dendrolimus kikuchii]